MARILFEYLLPLLLPTAIYALWLARERRRAATAGTTARAWEDGPWFWLALGGIALTAAVFVTSALVEGYRPGFHYTPAQMENGKIVPGQFNEQNKTPTPGASQGKE
jgi:heme A synthase